MQSRTLVGIYQPEEGGEGGKGGGSQIICPKTANGKRAASLTSWANTYEPYLFILLPGNL